MPSILDFQKKYYQKIDSLDLELIIASVIKKPREFVLTHPEYKLKKSQISNLKSQILRRIKHEPIAYILGKKEFYGLEFKVDKNTLIPRPETEMLVEHVLRLQPNNKIIIDVGTGSGNIIISLAKNLKGKNTFFATDISYKALNVAKQNAKKHKLSKKIKFLHGNLLEPILKVKSQKSKVKSYIIIANLPYLSQKIYNSSPKTVKNYEPKSALLSKNAGLAHYQKLFQQIKRLRVMGCGLWVFLEFSPEQKTPLKKAVSTAFPQSHPVFFKDLSGKSRVAQIKL